MAPLTKKPNGGPSLSSIQTPRANNLKAKSFTSVAPKAAHVPHAAHQHNGPLVPLPHCRFHDHGPHDTNGCPFREHERKCKSTSYLSSLRRSGSAGARAFKPGRLNQNARTKS